MTHPAGKTFDNVIEIASQTLLLVFQGLLASCACPLCNTFRRSSSMTDECAMSAVYIALLGITTTALVFGSIYLFAGPLAYSRTLPATF